MRQNQKIRRMVMIALFSALSYAAMLVVHIKVSFLTMDVKDALIALCGLYFGPFSTVFISVLVSFLELITISETGLYGFIMNILGSVAFALTVALFYKWKKTLWNAVWGLVSGVLVMTAVMVLANLFITPYFLGTTMEAVRGLIPSLLLPFNLLKGVINAGLVLLLYKPLSRSLKKLGILERREAAQDKDGVPARKSPYTGLFVTLAALALIASALTLILTVLGGHFGFGA